MTNKNFKKIAMAIAIASIPALTGCGSNNNNSPQPSVGVVPGGVVGTVPGGCIPVNTPQIPFTATNIYFSSVNIRGGMIPSSGAIGQMVIGGAAAGGPYQRSGVDGIVSMNITPMTQQAAPYPGPYYGYGYGTGYGNLSGATQASATGYVSISQMTLQDIVYKFGGMNGAYNSYYPTPGVMPQPTTGINYPCVSGIAIDVGHYYNTIYGGNVYLYLNNTQHGYALYF